MGKVSPIAEPVRVPVAIRIRPDLFDHRFEDRPVFPAVEAMETMAGAVARHRTDAPLAVLDRVRFDRFLPVPEGSETLEVVCQLAAAVDGGIAVEMLSRVRLPSGFTRSKVHAAAVFCPDGGRARPAPPAVEPPEGRGFAVSAKRLYRELVPFGPGFQSLTEEISLFEGGARAAVRCPRHRPQTGRLLGNAFVLDGAFHAACAWGQRFAGIVAFPVAIDRRRVLLPTCKEERYTVLVAPVRTEPKELVFRLEIADGGGRRREVLEGLRMRDVGAGRVKPPEWIRKGL